MQYMLESDAHVEEASNDSEDGCECLGVVGGRFAHGLVYSWKDPLLSQGANQRRPVFRSANTIHSSHNLQYHSVQTCHLMMMHKPIAHGNFENVPF